MSDLVKLILAFMVAFLMAFLATPLAEKLAHKIGAIDVPKDARRMHKKPIPRLGGLAIFFGFAVAMLMFAVMTKEMMAILAGSLIIVALGVLDDRKPIRAIIKLLVQIVAAFIVVYFGGVKIDAITNPNIFSPNVYLELGWLAIPVTIIWICGVTNAVNLIDGLDGLAAGIASISSICIMIIALLTNEYHIAVFTACLAGACIGFLPYNFNPAKIFMGDSGSTFLGFALACISIEGMFKGYAAISFAVPLLVLALPIFDTTVAILRRVRDHRPIMAPDRGHFHHKLIDMGFTQKQAVGIMYAISALLGISAVILTGFGMIRALVLLVIALVFVIATLILKNTHDKDEEEK